MKEKEISRRERGGEERRLEIRNGMEWNGDKRAQAYLRRAQCILIVIENKQI